MTSKAKNRVKVAEIDVATARTTAIRCSFEDRGSGKTKVAYSHSQTRVILCKANTLVDESNGDDFVEICQRPRRFMYVDPRFVRQIEAHPELRPFVNGAYTDDNGKIIRSPAKGQEPVAQDRDRCPPERRQPLPLRRSIKATIQSSEVL